AQLVLLIGQQVAALAIGQGCYDLIILTDKGTAGHFSWVRSEHQLDPQVPDNVSQLVFAMAAKQLQQQRLQAVLALGLGAGKIFQVRNIGQVQELVKTTHDRQDIL